MVDFLAFRGPDGPQVWSSGGAGLCHTHFRVSTETDGRPQLTTVDGSVWIAGDARIDDRETLIDKLPGGPRELSQACSAELILHAYARWGSDCLDYLRGDFSFIIWDSRHREVFAARDHLGVRPLFYALAGQCLIISNTLDCIRQIPIVSGELNERAIGDFLLAGENRLPTETYFEAIRRLPVAHRLIAGAGGLRTERYWTLPIDEPLYYRRTGDYVDQFRELLGAAVKDRLPEGTLGIFMSGGLDSPALAATAVRLGAQVKAFTDVFDRLIAHEERHFAGLVAAHLGISIQYNVRDDETWGWDESYVPLHTPEPVIYTLGLEAHRRFRCEVAQHTRVVFIGDGPDAALSCEARSHLAWLARQGRWGRLCHDLLLYVQAFRRIPLAGSLPGLWKPERQVSNVNEPSFPQWINPCFEKRIALKERWAELAGKTESAHPIRQDAYASFNCDFPMDWPAENGGSAGEAPISQVHPFWDVRVLRFLLAVPVVPWCRDKHLIRASFQGILPDAILKRPKSRLFVSPYHVRAQKSDQPLLPETARLSDYVNLKEVPEWPGQNPDRFEEAVRVLSLHHWLAAG